MDSFILLISFIYWLIDWLIGWYIYSSYFCDLFCLLDMYLLDQNKQNEPKLFIHIFYAYCLTFTPGKCLHIYSVITFFLIIYSIYFFFLCLLNMYLLYLFFHVCLPASFISNSVWDFIHSIYLWLACIIYVSFI